ncbi:hypothetical protein SLS62_006249 [Diatrype stigma]|uniref:Protein kinase domain-containing protein n=1 Tax=Diatrype stigma TaxID=117547 RepID=A0AAN9UMU5_9PEZI
MSSPSNTDASSVSDGDADGDYIQAVSNYLEDPKRFLNKRFVAKLRANTQYFNPYRRLFQLDAHIATGASANAYIFNEIDEEGDELRQVIVKLGHTREDDKDTQKELEVLDLLRASRHVVNLIDVEQSGLRRPILITEYLKNGRDTTPGEWDHVVTPIMKVIDFGSAQAVDPTDHPLGDMLNAVECLAIGALDVPEPEELQDVTIYAIPQKAPFVSKMHPLLNQPQIDPDIILLIGWCSAEDESDRPTLWSLLESCEQALRGKTEAYYRTMGQPFAHMETDASVAHWVETMILDPVVDDDEIDIE